MSAGAVLAIAVPVLALMALVALLATARRGQGEQLGHLDRETLRVDRSDVAAVSRPDPESEARHRYSSRPPATQEVAHAAVPAAPRRRDAEEIGMTRRQLLNRGILATGGIAAGGLGTAVLAFLWPRGAGGFGSKVSAGRVSEVLDFIRSNSAPVYVPEARGYLAPFPEGALERGRQVYDDRLFAGMEAGLVALFQKCPHLGCRVPWCQTSQWFECPCHGSKYNRVGEKRGGPAPRGMDRFPIEFDGEVVRIDTGALIVGPEIGTNTTGQEPEGPHCV